MDLEQTIQEAPPKPDMKVGPKVTPKVAPAAVTPAPKAIPLKPKALPKFSAIEKELIPTFKTKLLAIASAVDASTPGVQQNFPRDEDARDAFDAVTMIIKNKVGKGKASWTAEGKRARALNLAIRNLVTSNKSKNKVLFLKTVAKIIDPSLKPFSPTQKIKPGETLSFPPPDIKLGPGTKKFAPDPNAKKKTEDLMARIAEYQNQLAALRDQQRKLEALQQKAKKEKENLHSGISERTLKYFSFIDKHCSEYLKAVKATKRILYRGQDDDSQMVFIGNPRDDREPKDSSEKAQKLFDACLSTMGFKALRGNSIFTSSDIGQAGGYGDVYAIFPVNGFNFAWSTKEDDLVLNSVEEVTDEYGEDSEDLYYEYEDYFSDIGVSSINDIKDYFYNESYDYDDEMDAVKVTTLAKKVMSNPAFKKFAVELKKWGRDIDAYDSSEGEIYKQFINVMTAYLKIPKSLKYTPISGTVLTAAKKELEKAKKLLPKSSAKDYDLKTGKVSKEFAQKVVSRYGYKKDDLVAALKSRSEVIVNGNFIAMNDDEFGKQIQLYYGLTKKSYY